MLLHALVIHAMHKLPTSITKMTAPYYAFGYSMTRMLSFIVRYIVFLYPQFEHSRRKLSCCVFMELEKWHYNLMHRFGTSVRCTRHCPSNESRPANFQQLSSVQHKMGYLPSVQRLQLTSFPYSSFKHASSFSSNTRSVSGAFLWFTRYTHFATYCKCSETTSCLRNDLCTITTACKSHSTDYGIFLTPRVSTAAANFFDHCCHTLKDLYESTAKHHPSYVVASMSSGVSVSNARVVKDSMRRVGRRSPAM